MENDFKIENGVLLKYLGTEKDIVIPYNVTDIGSDIFDLNIKYLKVSNNLKIIDYDIVGSCQITSVIIPESVDWICDSAFAWSGVKEVTIYGDKNKFGKLSRIFSNIEDIKFIYKK